MIDDENNNQQGITAYHGSPHDFDQFDTSKIGTGEGNQSYGHGLYFAEAEPTARHYQELLSSGNPTLSGRVKSVLAEHNGDENAAKGYIQQAIDYHTSKGNSGGRAFWQNALDQFDDLKNYNKGHMYEVHIDAHPDHFLNWDKPLSEQHPNVQKFLSKSPYPPKEDQSIGAWLKPLLRDSQGMPEYWSYDMLKAGIPGIRYLDAGSRNAQGDPTHNYVVFDHNRVKVKRRYKKGGRIDAYGDYIERTKRATGGRIPHADKLFNEAKKTLDNQTKPMLNVHDDAIVHALRIAQGRV